jgi:hypothetical protein
MSWRRQTSKEDRSWQMITTKPIRTNTERGNET